MRSRCPQAAPSGGSRGETVWPFLAPGLVLHPHGRLPSLSLTAAGNLLLLEGSCDVTGPSPPGRLGDLTPLGTWCEGSHSVSVPCVWLISLGTLCSGSARPLGGGRMLFQRAERPPLCVRSPVAGHLGCCHHLATMCDASVNIGFQVPDIREFNSKV